MLLFNKYEINKYYYWLNYTELIPSLGAKRRPQAFRPASEDPNIDRRLVPYTRDAMRTKSRIEFIYLFIYLYIYINCGPHARGIGILALVNNLQQKLIWLRKQTWNGIYSFFSQKEI